jgi:hypothetical protein
MENKTAEHNIRELNRQVEKLHAQGRTKEQGQRTLNLV